jgi:hypothetical protein
MKQCPLCKMAIIGELRQNIPIQRLVSELSSECPNDNCFEVLKIGDIQKHLSECEFTLIKCPISLNCGEITRKNMEEHSKNECPYRIVKCILNCGK